MGSLSVRSMREKYPGKDDREVAAAIAAESGDLVILRYKNTPNAEDFDNFARCPTSREVEGYFTSPHCHQTEVVFDNRSAARPRVDALRGTVSMVCYLLGSQSPPADREQYCRHVLARNYRGKVNLDNRCICIGIAMHRVCDWILERAVHDYQNMVRRHQIPDYGAVADVCQGTGPDGIPVLVLLFAQ